VGRLFDRVEGRVIRGLTIVDDATHEAMAIGVERAISGYSVARALRESIHAWRGYT